MLVPNGWQKGAPKRQAHSAHCLCTSRHVFFTLSAHRLLGHVAACCKMLLSCAVQDQINYYCGKTERDMSTTRPPGTHNTPGIHKQGAMKTYATPTALAIEQAEEDTLASKDPLFTSTTHNQTHSSTHIDGAFVYCVCMGIIWMARGPVLAVPLVLKIQHSHMGRVQSRAGPGR